MSYQLDWPRTARKLRCPKCGGFDIEWGEYVLQQRTVHGIDADGVLIISESDDMCWEATKDDHLACKTCWFEWPVDQTAESVDYSDDVTEDPIAERADELCTAVELCARPVSDYPRTRKALALEVATVDSALEELLTAIKEGTTSDQAP